LDAFAFVVFAVLILVGVIIVVTVGDPDRAHGVDSGSLRMIPFLRELAWQFAAE
jgi:hypothetical protein